MNWLKSYKGKGLQKNYFLIMAIIGLVILLLFSPEDSSLIFGLGEIFLNSDSERETNLGTNLFETDNNGSVAGNYSETGTNRGIGVGITGAGTYADVTYGQSSRAGQTGADNTFCANSLQTGIEYRLETILNQMDGIENATILMTFSEGDNISSGKYDYTYSYPPIEGILVVMDNGDDSEKVLLVTHAIQALFSIEAHRIEVINRIE
ncbi:MAG: hypothetical protein ACI4DU_11215 [Lachnospiraceae bacterium]